MHVHFVFRFSFFFVFLVESDSLFHKFSKINLWILDRKFLRPFNQVEKWPQIKICRQPLIQIIMLSIRRRQIQNQIINMVIVIRWIIQTQDWFVHLHCLIIVIFFHVHFRLVKIDDYHKIISSLTTLILITIRLNYMKHVKIAIQSFFFARVKENISYQ